MDVAKVDRDVAYVAIVVHICSKCLFPMFKLFYLDVAWLHLDVAYVAVAIHGCCKYIF